MDTVEIDGVPIRYVVDGGGGSSPLIVLHGGLGLDHQLYRRTLAPLVADRPVVHFDQRGNGRSVPADPSTITMERLADDVVGLGDHLGLSRFTVLGHSYGAFVAQELALRPPRSSGRDGCSSARRRASSGRVKPRTSTGSGRRCRPASAP